MIFHKEKKLCMFEPPKNGTTTARYFLKNIGWKILTPEHAFPNELVTKYPNLRDYKYYVFLRNPLERFISINLQIKRMEQNVAVHSRFAKVIEELGLDCNLETLTHEQIANNFAAFKAKITIMYAPQVTWVTLPGTEVLDFDNYEAEIRRVSEDYSSPLVIKNQSTGFGATPVTQKVIDFVRQHYAADYALAKDRLGKEY